MDRRNISAMSSPVTISAVESVSDVESAISVGDKAVPDTTGDFEAGLFDLGDEDLRLVVDDVMLETHKYLIKKFSGLKSRIQNNTITIDSKEPGVEDFRNTFKILYASVVEGPFHFDSITLISALRIATVYDYPSLRNFAIKRLEQASLTAVERIPLAREFGLASWEEAAYVELCSRDEKITKEEASVLGFDAFVHVAGIREKEQRRRGKDIDAMVESHNEPQPKGEPTTSASHAEGDETSGNNVSPVVPDSVSNETGQDGAKETSTEQDKKGKAGTIPHPSFVDVPTKGTRWRQAEYYTFVLDAPGCTCTTKDPGGPCALPPCVASAIKHLQIQQLAHDTSISKLETGMEHVQSTITVPNPKSKEADQTEVVEEEVRKWLTGVEGYNATA